MLFRFSLYGFLKNQRYFEPFMILAFLEKGLSFFQIGLLIGFRELCINLMEIPTGAVADIMGRRKTMIFSHVAYAASFIVFGTVSGLPLLFAAMFLFSAGEAFRTGTHKAIIFSWLVREGLGDQRTAVYGYTRSWSKIGSAVSVLVAAVIVMTLRSFSAIFWISAMPAGLNIINFLTYPGDLDGNRHTGRGLREIWRTLLSGCRECMKREALRTLLIQSMGFEGVFKVSKDYLQPVLRQMAIALPLFASLGAERRTALMVGLVYALLHLLSSIASRKSEAIRRHAGNEEQSMGILWLAYLLTFLVLLAGAGSHMKWLAVLGFIILAILQNLWRPILIGAVSSHASDETMATVLSVESQAKSLFSAFLAPLTGLAVDVMPAEYRFVPVAVLGIVVAASGRLIAGQRR